MNVVSPTLSAVSVATSRNHVPLIFIWYECVICILSKASQVTTIGIPSYEALVSSRLLSSSVLNSSSYSSCPTSRILKFFDPLTWNKKEKSVQIHLPNWQFYLPLAVGLWETASPVLFHPPPPPPPPPLWFNLSGGHESTDALLNCFLAMFCQGYREMGTEGPSHWKNMGT